MLARTLRASCCPITLFFALLLILVFSFEHLIGMEAFLLTRDTLFTPRLVLSFLAHSSAWHLLANLFGLLVFGVFLERDIKSWAYAFFLFFSGVLVNLALPLTPYHAVLGASGVVYALAAALAVRRPFQPVFAFGIPMPGLLALVLWILSQFALRGSGSTAYDLHLAGLLLGMLTGRLLPPRENRVGEEEEPLSDEILEAWEDAFMRS